MRYLGTRAGLLSVRAALTSRKTGTMAFDVIVVE